ncbi:hypothetical protein G9A89_018188 [Geosiphon pyriformis]|nr:hypothetical protein G9A89_018188 [Geosiphon pyriformis]
MELSFNIGVKSTKPKKKKRDGALEDNIVSNSRSWSSETSDTIESDSMDMEEKCLVEETSFDCEDNRAFTGKNLEQMPKSSKTITKRVLRKLLEKINFLNNDNDNILLNKLVVLSSLLKNLVNVSVRKSFTLDISLDNVVKKSAQEKLVAVRKLFSKINGFGGTSTPSKFAGIIRAIFTSELSLAQASKKAEETKILTVVLKKISVETSTEAVCTALSGFGVVQKAIVKFSKSEQADLVTACWSILIGKNAMHVARTDQDKELWNTRNQHRALLYTLPIEMTAYDIWNYIGSVSGKTYTINHHSIIYAQARYAVVCFESANFLNAVMRTNPVLRGVNMYWSLLGFSKCVEYGKIGHTSLGCTVGENLSSGKPSRRPFSDIDKSRLATIYAKCLAPIARSVAFGGIFWVKIAGGNVFLPLSVQKVLVNFGSSLEMKPTLSDMSDVEKRFAVLKSSLASLVGQIGELAKRLDSFMLTVFQPSPGCQLLVTSSSQDRVGNIVMKEDLGEATSGKTATTLDFSASPKVKRLENMLEGLFASVLSLTARFESSVLAGSVFSKPPSQ